MQVKLACKNPGLSSPQGRQQDINHHHHVGGWTPTTKMKKKTALGVMIQKKIALGMLNDDIWR